MSILFYRILHLFGAFMVLAALGGVSVHAANAGNKASNVLRGPVAILHGVGLLLLIVAGFGMLAKLGISGGALFPGWVWAKLVLWLIFGGLSVVPYKKPNLAAPIFWALPVLGALAAYLGVYKPF